MEVAGGAKHVVDVLVEPERSCDADGMFGHALGVAVGVAVLEVDGRGDGLDEVEEQVVAFEVEACVLEGDGALAAEDGRDAQVVGGESPVLVGRGGSLVEELNGADGLAADVDLFPRSCPCRRFGYPPPVSGIYR